jgi:hypothetical protein
MIAQEREPAFGRLRISWRLAHAAGDRSFGNINAEHEKLSVDARRSHVEFSATILKISSRTALRSLFLPAGFRTFEISLQYRRKPSRCHPTTVSGMTTISAFFHSDQSRGAVIQNNLSRTFSLGPRCRRLNTASCCRRARFSSRRLRREQGKRAIVPKQRRTMVNIVQIGPRIERVRMAVSS